MTPIPMNPITWKRIAIAIQGEFRTNVLDARGERLDRAAFDQIDDGRILTGRQAYDIGLVDRLGTRRDAIADAGLLADLGDRPALCPLVEERGAWEQLFGALGRGIGLGLSQGLQQIKCLNFVRY